MRATRGRNALFGVDAIGVGVGVGIGIEGVEMSFGHERLDVDGAACRTSSLQPPASSLSF